MTKGDRQKWLDALRSGKYQQTQKILRDETGWCCLGVAVDQLAPEAWEYTDRCGWQADGDRTKLTDRLRVRIGLGRVTADLLVRLNDEDLYTFPEIADHIEKHIQPTDDPKDTHATD